MNIYVSNLSFNVQDEDLREFFTPYGDVSSAKVIMDRESGRSRGFGFVEMNDDTASKKSITALNDAEDADDAKEDTRDQEKKIDKLTTQLQKQQKKLLELETMRTTIRLMHQ